LPLVYGSAFRSGVLPATLALSTAIVHMGSAPASARLTIVSIRTWGLINALWAAIVAVGATMFVARGGATSAAAVYLVAHLIGGIVTFLWLRHHHHANAGMILIYFEGALAVAALVGLEFLRLDDPARIPLWTGLMAVTVAVTLGLLMKSGSLQNVAPDGKQMAEYWRNLRRSLRSGMERSA